MGNKLREVFSPTLEQGSWLSELLEEARAEYEEMLATTPDREGTTERIKSCPNSYGHECHGVVDWTCGLAPGFCEWDCGIYHNGKCIFEFDARNS